MTTFAFAETNGTLLNAVAGGANWAGAPTSYMTQGGSLSTTIDFGGAARCYFANGQGNTQAVQALLRAYTGATGASVSLQVQANASQDGYRYEMRDDGDVNFTRNGTFISRITGIGAFTSDVTMKIAYNSTTGQVVLSLNGTVVDTYTDGAPLTGGFPGLYIVSTTVRPLIDDWTDLAAGAVTLAGAATGSGTATGAMAHGVPLAGAAGGAGGSSGNLQAGTVPVVTGVSTPTPANGAALVITGTNFGATQSGGGVTIGGTACTVTSWSNTSITVTVARGLNKYGVALSIVVASGLSGNSSAPFAGITGLTPQAGWSYVNLTTPNPVAAQRITAAGDLAAGDQLAWDTKGGTVFVMPDASFVVG